MDISYSWECQHIQLDQESLYKELQGKMCLLSSGVQIRVEQEAHRLVSFSSRTQQLDFWPTQEHVNI